jgi:integrase
MRALTARQAKAAQSGRHYLGDGLCFIVSPDGTRRKFIFRYTSPLTHKPNETLIGYYPAVSYHDARAEVARMRALLAKGIDPVQAKREQRIAGTTFKQVWEEWKQSRKGRWRSDRNINVLLEKHGKPLAGVPVSAITPALVRDALKDLFEKHPEQGHRALNVFARVLDYAKVMGYRTGDNPASWKANMEFVFPSRPKSDRHYPSLNFKFMPEFIRRLHIHPYQGASISALEFLVLTACRPGEVIGMLWSELDLINAIWKIPPHRTKQNRVHRVPFGQRCMDILQLRNEYRINDFVFTGYNHTALDPKALRMQLRSMGLAITPHGFRSSFREWAAQARISSGPNGELERIPRELAELCLGHTVKGKVEGAYWRSDELAQRRIIMDHWADYCVTNLNRLSLLRLVIAPSLVNEDI